MSPQHITTPGTRVSFRDYVIGETAEAFGAQLDALFIDTSGLTDTKKLELAAPKPLVWRALMGLWGRQHDNRFTTPRHAKKGRR